MKRILISVILLSSCYRAIDDPVHIPRNEVKENFFQYVTNLRVEKAFSYGIDKLSFFQALTPTIEVDSFDVFIVGEYRFEFSACKNEKDLVRSSTIPPRLMDFSFPIAGVDTFKLIRIEDNQVVKMFILIPSGDFFDYTIFYPRRFPDTSRLAVSKEINNWVKNVLPNQRYRKLNR